MGDVLKPFQQREWKLGHVTDQIGMTMIETPRIGEPFNVELRAVMIGSIRSHVIAAHERNCLYFRDARHICPDGAVPLSDRLVRFYDPSTMGETV